MKRTRFSTKNGLIRKIFTSISGEGTPRSNSTKTSEEQRADDDAADGLRIAPAPRRRLLEAEDADRDAACDQHEAAVVDRGALAYRDGLRDRGQDEGDGRDRQVHPEDRPPGPLGKEPAEGRPDGGEAAGDPEEQRESLAALAQRERLDDDRKRGGEHDRAAEALEGPERDKPALGDAPLGREPAEQRGEGEDADPQRDHPPVPERVGEATAVGEERSQRQQV